MTDPTPPTSMDLCDAVHTALDALSLFGSVIAPGRTVAASLPRAEIYRMPSAQVQRVGVGLAMGNEGVQVTVRSASMRECSDLADAAVAAMEGITAPTVAGAKPLPPGMSLANSRSSRDTATPEWDVTGNRFYVEVIRMTQDDIRPIKS